MTVSDGARAAPSVYMEENGNEQGCPFVDLYERSLIVPGEEEESREDGG